MKSTHPNHLRSSFLDISEFVLQQCTPHYIPSVPVSHLHSQKFSKDIPRIDCSIIACPFTEILLALAYLHIIQNCQNQCTPDIAPIDHDSSIFRKSPLFDTMLTGTISPFMQQFMLEETQPIPLSLKAQLRKKKNSQKFKTKSTDLWTFHHNYQLDQIVQDTRRGDSYEDFSGSESQSLEQLDFEDGLKTINSLSTTFSQKGYREGKDSEEESKESTIDLPLTDFSEAIEMFSKNPMKDIIQQIKSIEKRTEGEEEEKKEMVRKYLEKFMLEHQIFCYEESWRELKGNLKNTIKLIVSGIEETFCKEIGSLPFHTRRAKLLKYLEKKKKRIWKKKVSYDCRKKVADGRLRIKGKFVTREQAYQQLGFLANFDSLSAQEIKEMLERKIDESMSL